MYVKTPFDKKTITSVCVKLLHILTRSIHYQNFSKICKKNLKFR